MCIFMNLICLCVDLCGQRIFLIKNRSANGLNGGLENSIVWVIAEFGRRYFSDQLDNFSIFTCPAVALLSLRQPE